MSDERKRYLIASVLGITDPDRAAQLGHDHVALVLADKLDRLSSDVLEVTRTVQHIATRLDAMEMGGPLVGR